ncbi:MAG: hypothetical protein E7585_07410 [Ruminococcaceae bacterium]|nr:hypothetical protein [Oscillospiraceae bacterium]
MFQKAKPVWIEGLEREMNLAAVFEYEAGDLQNAELRITAAIFYRLFVNDTFVAFGPARTAQGYARVDRLPLCAYSSGRHNRIRVEVASYYCKSLSTCLQPGFLCAELCQNGTVIAYTGKDFTGRVLTQKEQLVERFSIQRHFGEIWDLTKPSAAEMPVAVSDQSPVFLPRVAPYPHYEDVWQSHAAARGTFAFDENLPCREQRYSWKEIPAHWGRFEESQISRKPYRWVQKQAQTVLEKKPPLPLDLKEGEYAVFDFNQIECGFLQLSLLAAKQSDVVVAFSEYCEGDTFSFTRMNCQNVVEFILPEGYEDTVRTFEPYTMRFAMVMVKKGEARLQGFGVKTFEREMRGAKQVTFKEKTHADIYRGALRTFAHNAVDLYSDCPSRERAGWLCDSYFTATAEHHFFGKVPVEDAFLENYRLCKDPLLPEGMLPMCYPADVRPEPDGTGHHIPQWCMWYVLEVKEYLTERNKAADPALFRPTVEGIIGYFAKFENSDGLLEDLPSWNFVEWSDANSWTKNVNYPTNFLYAAVLLAAYELYGDTTLAQKARRIQKQTAALSFDGELFTDNAERDESGVLHNTGNTSEAGQYYAILFGNIDPDAPQYAKWRAHLLSGCKNVAQSGRRFVPVNAFIGLYLRLKTLLQLEQYRLLLDEVGDFFGGMVAKTGTLWEYREMKGSFDHGFASYAAYAMCVALEKLRK